MLTIFERPVLPGWVYPCSTADIESQLRKLLPQDLAGLVAVGLVPAAHGDHWTRGHYFSGRKPAIYLYAYPSSLCYRQPKQAQGHGLDISMAMELHYGMRVERDGTRWTCRWNASDLRRFTLEHVLLQEVAHHRQHRRRLSWNRLRLPIAGRPA